ncbi:MAG TPA: hypothetical protein ACQGQI_11270, partial [Xylella sp.]
KISNGVDSYQQQHDHDVINKWCPLIFLILTMFRYWRFSWKLKKIIISVIISLYAVLFGQRKCIFL